MYGAAYVNYIFYCFCTRDIKALDTLNSDAILKYIAHIYLIIPGFDFIQVVLMVAVFIVLDMVPVFNSGYVADVKLC